MSSTPLMSEYPVEKKEDLVLSIPAIDESDLELVVGAPAQRRCFWTRLSGRKCCRHTQDNKKKSPLRRAVKWFFTAFIVLGIAGFFLAKHHHTRAHPVTCVALDGLSSTVELPLHKFTLIGLHPSLTGGDTHVIHSDDVKNGTVAISFELPADTTLVDEEGDAKLFVCNVAGPKYVGLGVHSKDQHHKRHHHGHRVKAISTTVKLPASEAGFPRSISLHGVGGHRRFGRHCMKKRVRKAIAAAVRAARAEKWLKVETADAE